MTKTFIPSPQQAAFFDFVETGHGNAVLEAVAGAGKTTTLIEGLRRMAGSISFVAFNTKIVKDIKAKATEKGLLSSSLRISTAHSAGVGAWMRAYPKCNPKPNKFKVQNLLERAAEKAKTSEQAQQIAEVSNAVCKLVSFGKQLLAGVEWDLEDRAKWFEITERFSVDSDIPEGIEIERVINLTIWIFKLSRDLCPTEIDYDDMIYAPVEFKIRMFQNDWLLIDEAQDTNPARRALFKKMVRPGGRVIAVGDSKQAIYGFTGADGNALDLITKEFKAKRLPLTVTYRCPKAVVAEAQKWAKHIQAHPSAPEGSVSWVQPAEGQMWFEADAPKAEDAILCRYTKPLIQTAYQLIRAGRACKVEGRDIGTGLIQMAKRWKVRSLEALDGRLDKWLAREQAKAKANKDDSRAQNSEDKVETLRVFMERCRSQNKNTVAELCVEIEALFADDVTGVTTLSTIHKSKGREWPTIYWLQPAGMGRPPRHAWEVESEECCNYVAATRAQENLKYVKV